MSYDSKATRNTDSLTNAQGEFNPRVPRSEPMETSGHQVGQKVSPADHAPEFQAQTLPPGSAPKSRTFRPNPVDEVPGQANNPDVERSHGKEGVKADPLDFPGATSGDVHQGYGHPGQGQTSNELRHEGQHTSKRAGAGLVGAGAQDGSGLRDDGNSEARGLASDHSQSGPRSAQQHNTSLDGAESRLPESADSLAAERD